jgi:hypothetical protein
MKVEHNTKGMTANERAAYWLEYFNKQQEKMKKGEKKSSHLRLATLESRCLQQ